MKIFFIIIFMFLILQNVWGFDFEERETQSDESLTQLYMRWKRHFSIQRLPEESEYRFKVFKDHVIFVQETKKKLKLNKFADLTFREFSNIYAHCNSASGYDSEGSRLTSGKFMYENATDLPDSIDWREKGAVTPVKDQKECCSCWAFSSVAAVEGISQIRTGKLVPLSEQELVDCATYKETGCVGGFMSRAFDFIKSNGGITTEENYPYKAINEACQNPKKSNATIDRYENVTKNEDALLKAVAHQPVSVAIDADNTGFQNYTEGIYQGDCGKNLDHAMTVVGYGSDENKTKFWIVKNSWGRGWGEDGYIRIAREVGDPQGLCGIAMDASYPVLNLSALKDEDNIKDEL